MKRGNVFDARLNPTEGSEQAGVRLIVVVSRNASKTKGPAKLAEP